MLPLCSLRKTLSHFIKHRQLDLTNRTAMSNLNLDCYSISQLLTNYYIPKQMACHGVAVVEQSTRRLGDREVRGSNLGAGETFFVE